MAKHRFLGGVLSAAAFLTATAGHAEGFHFGISGGISSFDLNSKSAADAALVNSLNEEGLDVPALDSSIDDSGGVWGLEAGYRWNSYVGAELGYIDLGRGTYKADFTVSDGIDEAGFTTKTSFSSTGITLAVVGYLPVANRFDIHAKGGVLFSDTRVQVSVAESSTGDRAGQGFKDRDTDLFAGIGAAWNISESYAVRAEYRRFFDVGGGDTGETDVDAFTLSLLFR